MNTKTADLISLACVATTIVFAAILYPDLPEQIPTHWNAAGEVDDYTAKPWGVIVLPAAAVFSWVLMKLIPVISPKGFRTDEFQGVVNVFQVAFVSFMSVIAVLVLLSAYGVGVPIDSIVPLGVGLLFVVIGNYMGKVRKNFFIGIRTPWTLASDEVWARTHRLGGRLFMLCGALLMLTAYWQESVFAVVWIVVAIALSLVVYSYLLYRRIEGFTDDEGSPDPSDG